MTTKDNHHYSNHEKVVSNSFDEGRLIVEPKKNRE